MHSETERIFRVLESYNVNLPEDHKFWNNLFLWNSEQREKFNIWKLLVSQGFVGSTKID